MPNLDEFLNKEQPEKELPKNFVKLGGSRWCGKCDEEVIGALWDEDSKILTWKCTQGHENSFQVD